MTSWPITLWDVAKQAPVDAVLVEGIAEKQLQDWQLNRPGFAGGSNS